MNKTIHSPAPWCPVPSEHGGTTDILDARGYVVAIMCSGIGDTEEAANKQVVLKAPQLLRTVEALCAVIERTAPALARTMEFAHAQAVLASLTAPEVVL